MQDELFVSTCAHLISIFSFANGSNLAKGDGAEQRAPRAEEPHDGHDDDAQGDESTTLDCNGSSKHPLSRHPRKGSEVGDHVHIEALKDCMHTLLVLVDSTKDYAALDGMQTTTAVHVFVINSANSGATFLKHCIDGLNKHRQETHLQLPFTQGHLVVMNVIATQILAEAHRTLVTQTAFSAFARSAKWRIFAQRSLEFVRKYPTEDNFRLKDPIERLESETEWAFLKIMPGGG